MNDTRLTRRHALLGMGAAATAVPAAGLPPMAETDTPYVLPFSRVIPLSSAINGIAYRLYLRTPPGYASGSRRYPLILLLDADYSFALAANIVEHLAGRMNQAPDAIIAAVAYEGVYPDRDRYRRERTRDYTPIHFPTGGYGPAFQTVSGGGPAFLRMLADEALPLIDRTYRTAPDERTLVGHSYGGLFASWVLQERPSLFNRYLIVSPSLWYADRLILNREDGRPAPPLSAKRYVYLAVGSWEEQPQNQGFMVTELERFAAQLAARRDPNLIVKHRVFEDETHASIFPAALSTGIRHLFGSMPESAS